MGHVMTDLPPWCRVGVKVVCVAQFNLRPTEIEAGVQPPLLFMTYTIRETMMLDSDQGIVPCIRLVELVNPPVEFIEGLLETSWWTNGFRPLVDDEIEAELFKKKEVDA